MSKRQFNKKNSETYHLVHRPRDDPKAYDDNESEAVLVKVEDLNSKAAKAGRRDRWNNTSTSTVFTKQDEETFKNEGRRDNEGEAALYGIPFDDSSYDYMQHLKPMGNDPSAVFIARKDLKAGNKQNKVQFRENEKSSIIPDDLLPSKEHLHLTYQDQQNVPDDIAGFQPDMDPSLREVLEALDDDAYVENDQNDYFESLLSSGLAGDGRVGAGLKNYDLDEDNSESGESDSDLYGVVSDDENENEKIRRGVSSDSVITRAENEQDWETAFRQFKIDQEKAKKNAGFNHESDDELEDQITSLRGSASKNKTKNRRRKGPRSEASGMSMSSSAIFRNEGLTLLDDRFDQIEREYMNNEEEETNTEGFDMKQERADLDDIMNDFLDNYSVEGRKLVRNLKE